MCAESRGKTTSLLRGRLIAAAVRFHTEQRCLSLLLSLVAFMLLSPMLRNQGRLADLAISLLGTTVMLVAIYTFARTRLPLLLALIAVTITGVVTKWLPLGADTPTAAILASATSMAFFLTVLGLMLAHVLRGELTEDRLYGAIAAYLIIAFAFADVYEVIHILGPDSFHVGVERLPDGGLDSVDLEYFSVVTLTTLGYGDITPVSRLARTLAMLEAVLGVMYLGMFISRLIGMYASAQPPPPGKDD